MSHNNMHNDMSGYSSNELADKIIDELTMLADFVDEKDTLLTEDDCRLILATTKVVKCYKEFLDGNLQKISKNHEEFNKQYFNMRKQLPGFRTKQIQQLELKMDAIRREADEYKEANSRLDKAIPALIERINRAVKELGFMAKDLLEGKNRPKRVPFGKI